ncbi:MAG TPA: molybdopterin molybdotransferase MoeA [Sphingomicrobium sp.]|jgi:molybdopterin molybdotransferase|nr:molybdopterin molybdotransferase MoeA [Sphingomicrobium sp.]
MLSLAEARALLLADLPRPATETLPLPQCAARILAQAVVATHDQPPGPVSAMDGYAVRSADAMADGALRLIGEAPAGAPFGGTVGPAEAVAIATGGVVPPGADSILIQENVEREGDSIRIVESPKAGEFIRLAGCDFGKGQRLMSAGEVMAPARLALAAAANVAALPLIRRPRIVVLPSGDELREPGSELGPGMIVNSAAYAIEALVRDWGGEPRRLPILADDPAATAASLSDCGEPADVIVTIGGASVGDRDFFRPAAERLGARIIFDKVAVRPGKPCWHARFADGRLLLGLPGNPASAFVCAQLFLKPLLFALTGRDALQAVKLSAARLDGRLAANGARESYFRAIAGFSADGRLVARADPRQDSSLLTPLAAANALIRRQPHAPAAAAGDPIELLPIAELESW